MIKEEKKPSVSFFQKEKTVCPVCNEKFHIETMYSGRGRVNTGDTLYDLRKLYLPTEKYGLFNPLIYYVIVCPRCFYATVPEDFNAIVDNGQIIYQCKNATKERKEFIINIFGKLPDFYRNRDHYLGGISFILSLLTYTLFNNNFSVNIKKAAMSLRTSWFIYDLCSEEDKSEGEREKYRSIYYYFRYLAWSFYDQFLLETQINVKSIENSKRMGPDVDKDYGFNGAVYLSALLGYENKEFCQDQNYLIKRFKEYRQMLNTLITKGKKNLPIQFLEMNKALLKTIHVFIKENDPNSEDFILAI